MADLHLALSLSVFYDRSPWSFSLIWCIVPIWLVLLGNIVYKFEKVFPIYFIFVKRPCSRFNRIYHYNHIMCSLLQLLIFHAWTLVNDLSLGLEDAKNSDSRKQRKNGRKTRRALTCGNEWWNRKEQGMIAWFERRRRTGRGIEEVARFSGCTGRYGAFALQRVRISNPESRGTYVEENYEGPRRLGTSDEARMGMLARMVWE